MTDDKNEARRTALKRKGRLLVLFSLGLILAAIGGSP